MTEAIPIFCGDCGVTAQWRGKLAAQMSCPSCKSTNLGLVGVDARPSVVARRRTEAAGGTGWTGPDPRRYDGLAGYPGPTPQTWGRNAPVADSRTCPVCKGGGYDLIDKTVCRECGGTGTITHPTDAGPVQSYDPGRPSPAGGAAWKGASVFAQGGFSEVARHAVRRSSDPMGSVEDHVRTTTPGYTPSGPAGPKSPGAFNPGDTDTFYPKADTRSPNLVNWSPAAAPSGPYQMDQASCPSCGHAPTELRKDKNEDAWWVCPHCGPLENIDRNPEVNPYSPPRSFTPNRRMKTAGRFSRNAQTGRVFRILATLHEHNQLSPQEAVELARKTVLAHPEGR